MLAVNVSGWGGVKMAEEEWVCWDGGVCSITQMTVSLLGFAFDPLPPSASSFFFFFAVCSAHSEHVHLF